MMKKGLIKLSISSVVAVIGVLVFWIGMPVKIVKQAMPQVSKQEELAEVKKLNQQVIQLYDQGKYAEAIPLAEQALAISKKVLGDNHRLVALSLQMLAKVYHAQERYTEAESLYQQSLAILKQQLPDDHPLMVINLKKLGEFYQSQEKYAEAEPFYQQLLAILKQKYDDDHPIVRQTNVKYLNNLAGLSESQGRYAEAEDYYQQSLAILKQLEDNYLLLSSTLNNLAALYYSQGRYAEAESLYQKSLEITKQNLPDNYADVAQSLNDLATVYHSQGRYAEAEPLFQESLEIKKQNLGDNHPSIAITFSNLAALYYSQGRHSEAESLYQNSLPITKRQLGDKHPDVALTLNNLAVLYKSQKRYSEAESNYQDSLAILEEQLGKNHPSVATTLNNLAELYDSQRKYSEAENYYQKSLAIRKQLGDNHPSVAQSLNNLASLYYSQGRYTKAESNYRDSLAIAKQQLGNDHPDVAITLNNLAILYESQGNITRAIELLSQALKLEEYNLSENLVAGDERQKQDYVKTIYKTTDRAISLNLQSASNNSEASRLALKTIFERKGRILDVVTNSLQILRQRIDDPQSQELLTELFAIRTQQANLIFKKPDDFPSPDIYRKELTKVDKQAKKLADELGRRSAEFRNLSQPITLEAIQEEIPADAALVELVRYRPFNPKAPENERLGKSRYAAYVLYPNGEIKAKDLGEAEPIDDAVEKLRKPLRVSHSRTIKNIKTAGRELDKIVMQPVRQLLGDTKTILLSPDAALNLIPFEALVDENNQYLVENYQITYLTSGRDLLRQPPNNDRKTPLVIANPKYQQQGEVVALDAYRSIDLSDYLFPNLPKTQQEAEAINILFSEALTLMGTKATENALKQVKNPDFLHIATHGFFEPPLKNQNDVDNPLFRSGLVFAGVKKQQSGEDNGILTAYEATLLNLVGTQLVVLSACDTGIGDISAGEGIYGLRRAFVIAGSESQLISLWKVEDTATKDLMVAYYKGLKDKKGRREALSQIQRDWLEGKNGKKYQHPYYWASFIFSGDSTPMEF